MRVEKTYSPRAGRSSSAHAAKARRAASWIAAPAKKVSREAEALPLDSASSVDAAWRRTLSTGAPTASAAICRNAVCAPCPVSAPTVPSHTSSTSAPPRSSIQAWQESTMPWPKPTFLQIRARPRPRATRRAVLRRDVWKRRSAGPRGVSCAAAAWVAACSTSRAMQPGGTGPRVAIVDPSRHALMRRSSSGGISSARASRFIWVSSMKAAWGLPKPRKAPVTQLLVKTARPSMRTWGIS